MHMVRSWHMHQLSDCKCSVLSDPDRLAEPADLLEILHGCPGIVPDFPSPTFEPCGQGGTEHLPTLVEVRMPSRPPKQSSQAQQCHDLNFSTPRCLECPPRGRLVIVSLIQLHGSCVPNSLRLSVLSRKSQVAAGSRNSFQQRVW